MLYNRTALQDGKIGLSLVIESKVIRGPRP